MKTRFETVAMCFVVLLSGCHQKNVLPLSEKSNLMAEFSNLYRDLRELDNALWSTGCVREIETDAQRIRVLELGHELSKCVDEYVFSRSDLIDVLGQPSDSRSDYFMNYDYSCRGAYCGGFLVYFDHANSNIVEDVAFNIF